MNKGLKNSLIALVVFLVFDMILIGGYYFLYAQDEFAEENQSIRNVESVTSAKKDESIIFSGPISLKDGDRVYEVDKETIRGWVRQQGTISYVQMFEGNDFYWPSIYESQNSKFSEYRVSLYISGLSTKLNVAPQNAVLVASEGGVVAATPDKNGRELNVIKSTDSVISSLDRGETNTNLQFSVKKAEIRADNLVELGLTEKISQGYSNFAGSPVNRRHNVKTGAAKFNGYLIRPDDTFSFIKILGPVDASTGYLPELVIKENKTIPEYGGGMCQVSSTTFRAALNAGLPILERTPHSYPVSYYKPFGVDATVYIPKPDLVFKNDTGKYILVQTSIVGNNLYFDFYGTKPARTLKFAGNQDGAGAVPIVEKITPMIYDQGARGNGSFTAVFWRFVTDANGKTISSKFVSKYDSPDKYPH